MERVVNRKNPLSEISIPPHPLPPLKRLTLPVLSYIYVLLIYTDDWKCDQYRWVNQGVTKLPRKDPIIRKLYFSLDTPNGPCREFKQYGEHPSSTTASSITEIPIGQQAIGQEQQQPAFVPNNAPEVPNDGAASVPKSSDCANNCAFFIPNNAPEVPNDGAATDPKSSDCANECTVPHIQAAGDEEVMIVPSSGSFTCPFQYNPVDREWQQETCEAMGLNYITSNGITPGGRETPNNLHTHCWGCVSCLGTHHHWIRRAAHGCTSWHCQSHANNWKSACGRPCQRR